MAKCRQRHQHQCPGGEQLPGIGASLVGLTHQRQQGAGIEGDGEQQRLTGGIPKGLSPQQKQHGEQWCLQQGEAGDPAQLLPVEGDEEDEASPDAEGTEPEQQPVKQPLPARRMGGKIGEGQGVRQLLWRQPSLFDPFEKRLS